MITPDQIRAARALKNWSQTDLSVRTGLATPTIANIELGKQNPSAATLDKIIEAFTVGGISFTKGGVEVIDDSITYIEGLRKYHNILLDAYSTLEKGDELLLIGSDAKRSSQDVFDLSVALPEKGIICRQITKEGNLFIQGKPEEHRQIPAKYFTFPDCITIYADKVVSCIPHEDTWRFLIVKNASIAEDYRRIFKFFWDHGKPVNKYISIESYQKPMEEHYAERELEAIAKKDAIKC